MKKMKGLELSRAYYEAWGAPMIREKFPEYEDRIAVGLVGPGSECFGYDDAISMDHDFEAGFCLWLTKEDEEIVDQAIAYMELEEFSDRFIDELSGGQRQRAYIAMVIAQDTEYILLDEPTDNLDIYHATNMMKTVRKLCDELGKTVVLVLHEINYAAFYSDYICAFADGKIARFGTVEEVMTRENLSEIYQVDFEIQTVKGKPLAIYY